MNLLCYNKFETIFINVEKWISNIKMLENHWACFLLNLRNRELAWIALKIRKKNIFQGAKQTTHSQVSTQNKLNKLKFRDVFRFQMSIYDGAFLNKKLIP